MTKLKNALIEYKFKIIWAIIFILLIIIGLVIINKKNHISMESKQYFIVKALGDITYKFPISFYHPVTYDDVARMFNVNYHHVSYKGPRGQFDLISNDDAQNIYINEDTTIKLS